ncbi:YggT family protein [Desulfurispira natronophila]|uniref:YggT family protein n=1 Tax=Desulfurispira natronophila TaxID=682562 RepID=A0A7W7Y4L6_9BACT|nr:YggT family protein [Desulfurispira natronophila]MBB5021834.1 YggT family protein [Desulfurispira natronophila]
MSHMTGSFLGAIISTLSFVINIYAWILIARVFMSWINPDPGNPVVQFIYRITEPVLEPFRRFIPPIAGIDFSPIVVFILIRFLENLLLGSLRVY